MDTPSTPAVPPGPAPAAPVRGELAREAIDLREVLFQSITHGMCRRRDPGEVLLGEPPAEVNL
jgi:hypothetical protein